MASTSAETSFDRETAIKDAEQQFDLGMEALKNDNLDAAADAFGAALELRTRVYGELGSECASAYYRYGITLLERAQNNIGILGNKVEVVDEDEEDVDDDDEEEEEEEEGVEAMDAQQTAPAKDDKGKGKAPAVDEEEEGVQDDDEDDDEDEEDEEQGDEEEDDPNADKDDLQVAWEALETAKVLFGRDGDANAAALADIHMRLGDVQAENGQVEEAIREYDTCIAYQDRYLPPDARPRAEVRFSKAIALSLFEKPLEALKSVQEARKILESHIDGLREKLPGAQPDVKQQLQATITDLEGVLDDFDEREDDLREQAASFEDKRKEVQDSMQMIMSVLGSMTGGEGAGGEPGGEQPQQGQGGNGVGLGGEGAGAGPSGAAEVKDLGVVGRGKRRVQPVAVVEQHTTSPTGQKRSLESLMGGTPVAASASSNPFASVVPSGTPSGLTGSTPLLPVVKKLKIEGDGESPAPAAKPSETAAACAPSPVPAFLQKENVAAAYAAGSTAAEGATGSGGTNGS